MGDNRGKRPKKIGDPNKKKIKPPQSHTQHPSSLVKRTHLAFPPPASFEQKKDLTEKKTHSQKQPNPFNYTPPCCCPETVTPRS